MTIATLALAAFAVMATPWPSKLTSEAAFDEASRGEIAQAYQAVAGMPESAWRDREKAALAARYGDASRTCAGKASTLFCGLKDLALPLVVPPPLDAWAKASRAFHAAYWQEQARLARRWPKTSSEIATLAPDEALGNGYPDRTFLLTFDDGPAPGDQTPKLIQELRAAHVNGLFFVLGTAVSARSKDVYKDMCLGWHGSRHEQHLEEPLASASAKAGAAFLAANAGLKLFRPPYGVRSAAVLDTFRKQGLRSILWNVDTQDWSGELDADDVLRRVETLILTRRKGIILFHDIHPKARAALPRLFPRLKDAGVRFADCHQEIPGEP